MILKNGGLRAVLKVEPINFNLKSETEQQGIIAGYQAFINTLSFSLQVCVQSRRVNIDPYIGQIREIARTHKNELLQKQTEEYANFIERVVEVADIMQKHFYVIIPLDDEPIADKPKSSLKQFMGWMKIDDNESKAVLRYKYFVSKHNKLKERINLVESGLNNIDLQTTRLNTRDLIQLYYQAYNPRTSKEQKLEGDLNTDDMVL